MAPANYWTEIPREIGRKSINAFKTLILFKILFYLFSEFLLSSDDYKIEKNMVLTYSWTILNKQKIERGKCNGIQSLGQAQLEEITCDSGKLLHNEKCSLIFIIDLRQYGKFKMSAVT